MSKEISRVNRRSILRGIGVASAGSFGFSGVASAETEDEPTTLTGHERFEVFGDVFADEAVQALLGEFSRKGWEPQPRAADVVRHSRPKSEAIESVVLPFATDTKEHSVKLLWASDKWETSGFETDIRTEEPELHVYTVEDGDVAQYSATEHELAHSNVKEANAKNGDAAVSVASSPQPGVSVSCSDPNWDCVIEALGSTGITCYPCKVDPSKASCVPCAAHALLQGYLNRDECCPSGWEISFSFF